jgi:hypothetical protein
MSMRVDGEMVEEISQLSGLAKTKPWMASVMLIMMFSLAGIPPLAGFFAKFYVFLAAINAQLYTLAVIGVVTSVIGSYYYVHIVKVMYFDEPQFSFDRVPGELKAVLTLTGLFVLLFCLYPMSISSAAGVAARSLFCWISRSDRGLPGRGTASWSSTAWDRPAAKLLSGRPPARRGRSGSQPGGRPRGVAAAAAAGSRRRAISRQASSSPSTPFRRRSPISALSRVLPRMTRSRALCRRAAGWR